MKIRRPSSTSLLPLKGAATLMAMAAVVPSMALLAPSAQAAPKQKLEIWPGQRVLLVLPISVSQNWNQDAALGTAVLPLIQPELQRALKATKKFSITVPYRFDPVLQRALVEKQVTDEEVTALTKDQSLEAAQSLFSKVHFEQPTMIAQVQLEELRLSGADKSASVQLQATGRLYQQGNGAPVKSITATSHPVSGGSSESRITRAAQEVFAEIAAEFIAPPPSFALPAMTASAPTTSAPTPVTPTTPAPLTVTPIPPGTAPVTAPNSLSPQPGGPFIPMLPPAQPPLGITVPNEPVAGR